MYLYITVFTDILHQSYQTKYDIKYNFTVCLQLYCQLTIHCEYEHVTLSEKTLLDVLNN